MRVRELPTEPKPGVVLYCPSCRRTWSACRSDYFMLDDEHILSCDCRGVTLLELGKEERRIRRIKR